MRQVDDAPHTENQGQAKGQQQVVAAQHQAVDHLLQQINDFHEFRVAEKEPAPPAGAGSGTVPLYIAHWFSDLSGASFSSGSLAPGTASPKRRKSCLCLAWPLGLTVKG